MLKKWEMKDNLTSEEPKNMIIWIKFFGILVEYWITKGFGHIESFFGCFVIC